MDRRLSDALAGGSSPLRTAVCEFLRPMLSPKLVKLNHEAFIHDGADHSAVDLAAQRALRPGDTRFRRRGPGLT
jgi:hypothetical protein